MRLTRDDRKFLERLAPLLRSGLVKLCQDRVAPHAFALTCPSWSDTERALAMSRQAIRRRAWRVFNLLYVPACETVILVEQHLGLEYRDDAMTIAHNRAARMDPLGPAECFQSANVLLPTEPGASMPVAFRPSPEG